MTALIGPDTTDPRSAADRQHRPIASALPQGLVSLLDHEQHAHTLLPEAVWAYFNGGAADETTLRANAQAWQTLELLPRVLRPLAGGHTRVQLLGRTLAHPILVAPMAHQGLAHPHGEHATALAAAALGAGLVVSTQASTRLEDVAHSYLPDADRGPLWFQLYIQPDRGLTCELVQRAEAAGYEALVLTVDAPVQGARDRERRAGFVLPAQVSAANLTSMPVPTQALLQPGQSALFDGLLAHAPTWDDVAWLRSITHLPVLLKGITHPADAVEAVRCGAAGIIASNHGGRTLDTIPATARLLPRVVQVVQGDVPVLVDGGIRRGTDVLKAMALGASAVLVGRPILHGLTNAGATGVAHVIRLLRDELEMAMALTGCRTLADAHLTLA
ncbi:MAG: alpha-hydroxy acid oxidase [Hydrogenophaga sp.]|uniref:alpha-hydroxy acid oxidase n=1 Tax=Hydrogenophaga sp. TaxID=1904254 RepID=UPI00273005F5|nr:alpha-hydroxy acid oxidase [Hydrogenophaga sp.]MDP2165800.1 alpha-hydroxy acid oxidase [Hydrogenophaga sp.]MDP3475274.1 alpha-hydroxy acid oxidase [Hydrogenophaga sp.]